MLKSEAQKQYTYIDYLSWNENERIEIMEGTGELFRQLADYLKDKSCRVYTAPFAVWLNAEEDENSDTVLEPDIVVVCDKSKLDDKGCRGVSRVSLYFYI